MKANGERALLLYPSGVNTCRLTIVDLPETRFLQQYLRQFLFSPTGYKPGRQSPTEGDPPESAGSATQTKAYQRESGIVTGCGGSQSLYSPTLLE